jgi:TfoX/Sxy family transcriptional regulator of competence genes
MNDDVYAEVKAHFQDVGDVEVNRGRGAQGLKHGGKMFVMFSKGDLLVRLDPARVAELVESGEAQAYDPGTGSPMKDRVLVPVAQKPDWIRFATESRAYVAGE